MATYLGSYRSDPIGSQVGEVAGDDPNGKPVLTSSN